MITSAKNPKLQFVRALIAHRKERQENHAFVVEGVRLMEDALASAWKPQFVLFSSQLSARGKEIVNQLIRQGVAVEEIYPHLMEAISGTETPQGILAVFAEQEQALPEKPDFVLIVDVLRDPGNLGTILRSAAAAGVQLVMMTPGTTDVFAPKVLRAGMGAHFRIPLRQMDWAQIRTFCQSAAPALPIYLAGVSGGNSCWQMDLRSPLALTIGGEADGASSEAQMQSDAVISIPMPGKSESLNAAVAAGILIFEVVRQRMQ